MTATVTTMLLLALTAEASKLKDVTNSVFGDRNDFLPMAFGDFNSDKLTDVFVIDRDRSKISVLLARPASLTGTDTYFDTDRNRLKTNLQCFVNNADIMSVIPGDFDGDGGMDVLLILKQLDKVDNHGNAVIFWGEHDQSKGVDRLICNDNTEVAWKHKIIMTSQPLLLDANGDYAADLFGSRPRHSEDGTPEERHPEERGVWLFQKGSRATPPSFVPLEMEDKVGFKKPFHSNSYVDVNGDGNADLFVFGSDGRIELWINSEGNGLKDGALNYVHSKSVSISQCDDSCLMGQAAFADFNLDGKIDVVIPLCKDGLECKVSSLVFSSLQDLFYTNNGFKENSIHLGDWRFDMDASDSNPYAPLTPRVGDINLDGYPDLLIRMKQNLLPTTRRGSQVFLNVAWLDEDEMPSPSGRVFWLQEIVMEGIERTTMAAFFDLYEDGKEDMLVVRASEGDDASTFEVGAFVNATQSNDAYFVKIIVLSGSCYYNCPGNDINVPYGTNMPGQTICYKTQRSVSSAEFSMVETCAAQLPQTAHTPLNLPYTIFGLGMSPNFLDYMFVNVTNASSHSHSHSWPQIIPNSQVYVIPFPPKASFLWAAKLFVTPGRSITLTALALLGSCLLAIVIIGLLHWREREQDKQEKRQEAHRFHFDAM